MSDKSERDGPFDLKPSEVIENFQQIGVNFDRREAAAIASWAYFKFNEYRLENLPKPPSSQP